MPSKVLYPPIVDSYMPAFKASSGSVNIYYKLSKFNASTDFKTVQVSILRQGSGANIVNTNNDSENARYRATGIIINIKRQPVQDENNLYCITLNTSDLKDGAWNPGWVYKVQIRLSNADEIEKDISFDQAQWLVDHSNEFSEWSTVCILKAIGDIDYQIKIDNGLVIKTENGINPFPKSIENRLDATTLELAGSFILSNNVGDRINYCQLFLYDEFNKLLEDSGEIYLNENQIDENSFHYVFKTELKDQMIYYLAFKFETANKYIGGFYLYDENGIDDRYIFKCYYENIGESPCRLLAVENDIAGLLTNITSKEIEEDEGRIALKFYDKDEKVYNGNLCIRRTDSKTNFQIWEDVYIYGIVNDHINNAPIFYDYTIESGVYYKYGVQQLNLDGTRTKLNILNYPIIREFNYSFLLGKNGKQLKLMFDNTMSNFKYQVMDSKNDTIGSKFANITRNAATYYRTFPINGLISFWMDENNLFYSREEAYQYEDVIELYEKYNNINFISQYDYIYEQAFRNEVLKFLQDGEIKLFKSPTEGNIIIRLTDINCVPNQSLGRMLYSFSSNAFEMDEPTMSNYLKYGFYKLNDLITDFTTKEVRLGQLQMDFTAQDNIIDKICQKYNTVDKNTNLLVQEVQSVFGIKITFDEKPLKIKNSAGEDVLGNNIQIGSSQENIITVYYPNRIYEFDSRLEYPKGSIITIMHNDYSPTVHATVDFLYRVNVGPAREKQIMNRHLFSEVGQLFETCNPDQDLMRQIYYKYYWESDTTFSRLNILDTIELQGDQGLAFEVKDAEDTFPETHVIGITETLRLYKIENIKTLRYLGVQDPVTGKIKQEKRNLIVNFHCTKTVGTYVKKET